MFFLISKLFWLVFEPSHLFCFIAIAAAILLQTRHALIGRRLAAAAAFFFFIAGFLPVGLWLLRPIEDRNARPAWPSHVDGILVLGDGAVPEILQKRGTLTPLWSDPRLAGTFELARHYPNARVIFSGGSGQVGGAAFSEVRSAQHVFDQLGLDRKRVAYEGRSRNTWENIEFSHVLAKPRPVETWVLAISAYQMPRAMLVARRMHWNLIAWPTDYMTPRPLGANLFNVPDNLKFFDLALHEWLGLLVYDLK